MKYEELRRPYPHLPSRYAYTACQDAAARAKSFLKRKEKGLTNREYPEVRRLSVWLDDHLWKPNDLTIEVTTHRGWIAVELEPHKHFWSYVNGGWKISSEARVRLDRRERRLVVYLVFIRYVEEYEPRGFVTVDVNENNVAALIDGNVHLFETGFRDLVLGYYYRRKRIQEKYGANSRSARKVMRKLKERKKKNDLRWKLANIIVRVARERQYAVVLERLGRNPAREMINHVRDGQLRHRIFQASFKGVQRAIEKKARENGIPAIRVDPRNTSRLCPLHSSLIVYSNGSRIGRCSAGSELWHRDVVACWNLLLKALRGGGSGAPSPGGLTLDGSPVPLGSIATHDPTPIAHGVWAR